MVSLTATVAGLVAEARTSAVCAASWAAGFGSERLHRPAPGAPARDVPVMLVHGLCANKSYWKPLTRKLLASGYTVYPMNYAWLGETIAECGRHVAADAEALMDLTGSGRVHVVAHSLGGVVTKWATHHTELGEHLASVVTLGSPHRGTPSAHLAPRHLVPGIGGLISQLRPGRTDLESQSLPLPGHVDWATVGGRLDALVPAPFAALPAQAGRSEHTSLPYLGHIAMVTDARVHNLVSQHLRAPARVPVTAA